MDGWMDGWVGGERWDGLGDGTRRDETGRDGTGWDGMGMDGRMDGWSDRGERAL